jgi:hypothetical protein
VPSSSFSSNGYNGSVLPNSASQLAGQGAFVLTSAGHAAGTFLTSVASLGTFSAGDTVAIRFRAAYDTNTTGGSPDWEITNVMLSRIPEPGSSGLLLLALAASVMRRSRRGGRV